MQNFNNNNNFLETGKHEEDWNQGMEPRDNDHSLANDHRTCLIMD